MHLRDPFVRALPLVGTGRPEAVGDVYRPLLRRVPSTSVTMATASTGWPVPTFGGRIVDPLHPQAFVADLGRRHQDVERFFAPSTPTAVRRTLLCRYRAAWILLRQGEADPAQLAGVAVVVGRRGLYTLMRVRPRCAA